MATETGGYQVGSTEPLPPGATMVTPLTVTLPAFAPTLTFTLDGHVFRLDGGVEDPPPMGRWQRVMARAALRYALDQLEATDDDPEEQR